MPKSVCDILLWLMILGTHSAALYAGGVIDAATAKPDTKDETLWYDIHALKLEGKAWSETKAPFDRLPGKAEGVVPPSVWGLSRHSTGMCVRFATDSASIRGRWTVTNPSLAMPHMPATGVSGLDLYIKAADGEWRWVGAGRPGGTTTTTALASGLPAGEHEFLLYLPLYNGVSSVEIGIPKSNRLKRVEAFPAAQRPIVFYGTSITQGGCASRPGMVYTSILGRKLNSPTINLGFSGSGKMEPAMAELLAELDPAVYVLDCVANMGAKLVSERTEAFVRTLRKAHPQTPIVLMESPAFASEAVLPGYHAAQKANRAALRAVFDSLTAAGVPNLSYIPGDHLFGDDGEGTVDGVHATDLGFLRQADAVLPYLKPLLPAASASR